MTREILPLESTTKRDKIDNQSGHLSDQVRKDDDQLGADEQHVSQKIEDEFATADHQLSIPDLVERLYEPVEHRIRTKAIRGTVLPLDEKFGCGSSGFAGNFTTLAVRSLVTGNPKLIASSRAGLRAVHHGGIDNVKQKSVIENLPLSLFCLNDLYRECVKGIRTSGTPLVLIPPKYSIFAELQPEFGRSVSSISSGTYAFYHKIATPNYSFEMGSNNQRGELSQC
jgi:hypothetical protein